MYPFSISAHLDSGATRNLFPSDLLESLNIELENNRKQIHYGIGGKELISYSHKVEILVGNFRLSTEIDFSNEHKPALLGVEGFFNFFDFIRFNSIEKRTELTYNSN